MFKILKKCMHFVFLMLADFSRFFRRCWREVVFGTLVDFLPMPTFSTLALRVAGMIMSEGVLKLVVDSFPILVPPIHGAGSKFRGRVSGLHGVGVGFRCNFPNSERKTGVFSKGKFKDET